MLCVITPCILSHIDYERVPTWYVCVACSCKVAYIVVCMLSGWCVCVNDMHAQLMFNYPVHHDVVCACTCVWCVHTQRVW